MPKIIKLIEGLPTVVDDDWEIVRDLELVDSAAPARRIMPLAAIGATAPNAVWIAPDDDFASGIPQLMDMQLIAVDFPSFRDGRGYSIATLLRTRYGWTGELRAIGDVLRDQLKYMRRCGFDAFAVRADKSIDDAVKSFSHYSISYQGAVDDPRPLFRRRAGGIGQKTGQKTG